jgi:hypothetical protein
MSIFVFNLLSLRDKIHLFRNLNKFTAGQKLGCSYILEIIGKHSGDISPIDWKMELNEISSLEQNT